jgi:hypothetical protein
MPGAGLGFTLFSSWPCGTTLASSATWDAGNHSPQPVRQTSVHAGSSPLESELVSSASSIVFCAPVASAQRQSLRSSFTRSAPSVDRAQRRSFY